MGRFKLSSDKRPSVWDRRRRPRIDIGPADRKALVEPEDSTPPALPDGCTWVGVFGVSGEPVSKATGDLFEAEVRRRGKPFVIWEQTGVTYDPGDIPVVVLFATTDDAIQTLADGFGKRDEKGRALFPFQCVRSTKSGDGAGTAGSCTPQDVARTLDLAIEIRDNAERQAITDAIGEVAEAAEPAND